MSQDPCPPDQYRRPYGKAGSPRKDKKNRGHFSLRRFLRRDGEALDPVLAHSQARRIHSFKHLKSIARPLVEPALGVYSPESYSEKHE
jgi:hypothetical protein